MDLRSKGYLKMATAIGTGWKRRERQLVAKFLSDRFEMNRLLAVASNLYAHRISRKSEHQMRRKTRLIPG
jgi:hypothetical protein